MKMSDPMKTWKNELNKAGLTIDDRQTEFIRLYPPFLIRSGNYLNRIKQEQECWKKNAWLKDYFFFGINFIAKKQ